MLIDALRTPDSRFENLPGYDFAPHYTDQANGLRMHYVDENMQCDGPVFLCLHGQPSWSYLYRKMIPIFAEAGRVVAPDLFGFGRSDKPVEDDVYTFDFHRDALLAFIDALDLRHITLVCQDWGGLLGLTLPVDRADTFERLIVMNTAFATGELPLGPGFEAWKAYNRSQPDLDVAGLFQASTTILTAEEAAAYGAPFPDARFKAGVRRFPELVPVDAASPGAATSRRARNWFRDHWSGQSFMAVGGADPVITPAAMEHLRAQIRGCPEPMMIAEAGHFVQEWGEAVAKAALGAFAR
jgi:pimeloyl-ACP methyl ester carboxylesterase